jgi:hypothetical protein
LPSISVELSGTDAIHLESADVTSAEQSDAIEGGTEYVFPVGGDVPASAPIGPLGTKEVVDALLADREVLEHATSATQVAATTRSEERRAPLATPTMNIITASRSRTWNAHPARWVISLSRTASPRVEANRSLLCSSVSQAATA